MSPDRIGLLLMAYGTPDTLADVEAYYTDIRGGRPPTPELLHELTERYRAIGGPSPLTAITRRQAAALEQRLNALPAGSGDPGFQVFVGMKHWHPYIAEAVPQMGTAGITRAVGLTLTPQYSRMSVGAYNAAATAAAGQLERPIDFAFVNHWHRYPAFVQALADRVRAALERFTPAEREGVEVLFTAHSLPTSILKDGDPYADHLRETAAAVAAAAGLQRWDVAWQSAGRTAMPWLGPDITAVLSERAERGQTAVLICPAGFVADHLEVLYDIDIECQQLARDRGLHLERTASLNDSPDFIAALADVVISRAREAGFR